jgi:acetyl-CoA C-acetyltransferase
MESMSNAPYYLTRARTGYRMGDAKIVDGMIFDGLWDPYHDYPMGKAGELCAKEFGLSREVQDEYARESYRRARSAMEQGLLSDEIAAVTIDEKKGAPRVVSEDEEPKRGDPSQFEKLRPAFEDQGTITAANASGISDGAAALVLASSEAVERHHLEPMARLVGYGGAAQAPEWFTTAPAKAIQRTLEKLALRREDIELWEINEAFSCVALACARLAGVDPEKLNVHGGAVALGHPIGASGARILTTLLYAMRRRGARRGLATLCIGGGEALAAVVERS